MTAGMLGRLHLSGHLDKMTDDQRALVTEAVDAYRAHRQFIATAVPFWPLGLPEWEDKWIVHGLRSGGQALVAIWRRGGVTDTRTLQLPVFATRVEVVYPTGTDATVELVSGSLKITLPHPHQAVVLALRSIE